MTHEAAIALAWDALSDKVIESPVRFLGEEYSVDVSGRRVAPVGRLVPLDDDLTLLILHYVARRAQGLPAPAGDWLSLSELSLADGFTKVYVERAVAPLRRAFGSDPERIYTALDKVPGERVERADAAIVIEIFAGVPMLVDIWRADEEFGADAGLLFDRSITDVFCTEDIVELAETAAAGLVDCCGRPG